MTKNTDDEKPRAKRKMQEVAGWLLMAMLVLGLGGFGVTNFGGRVTSVATVGGVEISAADYSRAVQTQVRSYSQQMGVQVSAQELLAAGLGQDVMRGLIARAALTHEAERIGLSVGDDIVASKVVAMDAFKGAAGSFDRDMYRSQLDRIHQSEAEFETGVRRDVTLELFQNMISGGITAPQVMTEKLDLWLHEKRDFSLLRLAEADLATPLPVPTEDELKAFHSAHADQFIKPEAKRITYVALLPQDIAAKQPVDEAAVKALYDERIDQYVLPERRIVDRLVYPDQAAADAARTKLDGGATFEDLVKDRGITLADTELGDMTREDLGEAGEGVFAAAEGAVVGPLPSNLGPAIFRVVTVLAAENTPLAEVHDTLALELQTEAARAAIDARFEAVDDLLAGGATLEDLAREEGMALATLDYVSGVTGTTAIEGYESFRKAADAVAEGDFPETIALEDGGLFALRLDEIVPEAPIPFDQARAAVTTAWHAEALTKALSARAAEIRTAVEAGAALGSFGIVDVTRQTDRNGSVTDAPAALMETVFGLAEAAVAVVDADGFVGVVVLDKIIPAATEGDEALASRAALATSFAQSISADAFEAFTTSITTEAGITLDQAAVDAVNKSLP